MSNDNIAVQKQFGLLVSVHMSPDRAKQLFHDINRVLSLIDELNGCHSLYSSDAAAYDRLNSLAALLQRELSINPEDGEG